MQRRTTLIRLLALTVLCVGFNSTAPAQPSLRAAKQFREWDRNADGKLTRNELPEGARRNFGQVDRDQNGSISLKEHAAFLQRGDRRRRTSIPNTVSLQRDIAYANTASARQTLHLLLPKERKHEKPLPVIVFVHGGGWRQGDKDSGLGRILPYVASGDFAGVSIGYRLSDEARWPAQIHDCKAAIRWIRGNAKTLEIDPERIGVWGTSAGGHLVAMLGVSGGVENANLEGEIGEHLEQSSRVACVVNFFGPSNLLTMNDFPSEIDHDAPNSPESKLIGGSVPKNKDKARHASPMTYISNDDVPIIHFHGTKDRLVPFNQSAQFDKKLKAQGVASVLITVEDGGHGFNGPEIDRTVRAWFEKHLLGKKLRMEDKRIATDQ